MKSRPIFAFLKDTMYMYEVDLFVYCVIHYFLIGIVEGKGGVRLDREPGVDTTSYPSQTRRKYYTYYINYFTGSGFAYARDNLHNSRTKTVCSNYEPYFGLDNDTRLGEFPCPMENDPDDFGYCCGTSSFEYCCRLVDTFSFRLQVGMSSAAVLGVVIGVIVCICFYLKAKKKQRERKKNDAQHMKQLGITHYEKETPNILWQNKVTTAITYLPSSKKNKFYQAFWTEIHTRYQKLSWKISRDKSTKEVKITFPEGGWVSLILVDELDGYPQMVVSREKAAVQWMNTVFVDICDKVAPRYDAFTFELIKKFRAEVVSGAMN